MTRWRWKSRRWSSAPGPDPRLVEHGCVAVEPERSAQAVDHPEGPFEPPTDLTETPGRTVHDALVPETDERREVDEDRLEGTAVDTGDVDHRRVRRAVLGDHPPQLGSRLGETCQHPTGGRREEVADRGRLGQERPELSRQCLDTRREDHARTLARHPGRSAPRRSTTSMSSPWSTHGSATSAATSPLVRSSTTSIERARISARSIARPAQNSASAARVGTDAIRSTCGSGSRRRSSGGATVPPTTQTSFAVAAVGRIGSSPAIITRALPPWSTSMPLSLATRCRRSVIARSTSCEPSKHGHSRPLAFGALGSGHERQRPHTLVVRRAAGQPGARRIPVLAEHRILEHAAPVRVGQAHALRSGGEQQAGHASTALGVHLHRVDPVVLQPTEDHVDRLETRQRTKPDPSLAHDQVGSLGEVESEPRREVRLLDERRVVDAAGQHDDAGIPVERDVGETIAQAVGERIERAERTTRRQLRDHVAMHPGRHRIDRGVRSRRRQAHRSGRARRANAPRRRGRRRRRSS